MGIDRVKRLQMAQLVNEAASTINSDSSAILERSRVDLDSLPGVIVELKRIADQVTSIRTDQPPEVIVRALGTAISRQTDIALQLINRIQTMAGQANTNNQHRLDVVEQLNEVTRFLMNDGDTINPPTIN